MIIVDCKSICNELLIQNKIICTKNNYIKKIEKINDELNEIIFQFKDKKFVYHLNLKGQLHNPIGPARIIYFDNRQISIKEYFFKDKRHRLDGPAYERFNIDGSIKIQQYFVDDEKYYSEKTFKKAVNDYNTI